MKTALIALLISLPDYYMTSETSAEREKRMEVIADGILSAADNATCTGSWSDADWCTSIWPAQEKTHLIVLLTTLGWHESRFTKHVHEGRCRVRIGECDAVRLPNGSFIALARSPWQTQRSPLVAEHWYRMLGSKPVPTFEAAIAAAKVAGAARERCARSGDGWLQPTISGYATGRSCTWKRSKERANTYERFWQRLHQNMNFLAFY